jgi:hypothetical protein
MKTVPALLLTFLLLSGLTLSFGFQHQGTISSRPSSCPSCWAPRIPLCFNDIPFATRRKHSRRECLIVALSSKDTTENDDDPNTTTTTDNKLLLPIDELEVEQLQERLTWIEALEARNQAQLESFVDVQDQWDSLEPEERQLLESKQKMEILAEELVQLWMGQKSMDG